MRERFSPLPPSEPLPAPGPEPRLPLAAPGAAPRPWDDAASAASVAFVTLWTTGGDPRRDGVFRVQAACAEGGTLDRCCDPWPGAGEAGEAEHAASARMAQGFGVSRAELAGAAAPREALAELVAFVGARPVVAADRAALSAWCRAFDLPPPERRVDLASIAGILLPGRLAAAGEELPDLLLGRARRAGRHPGAIGPLELRDATVELVRRALARAPGPLAVLAHGGHEAWLELARTRPRAARELQLVLSLAEHPSRWIAGGDGELPLERPPDGRLGAAARALATLADAADESEPRWALAARAERRDDPLPNTTEGEERLLGEADLRTVDEIFQVHLPRLFAEAAGERDPARFYRPGQHEVASGVARGFGKRELLLVHAPTGTGKTLAYLVPVLLWAVRNEVRVGVATYTRALQEQALDRDVPLALAALRAASAFGSDPPDHAAGGPRVALLKGRNNYVCWRALRLQLPTFGADGVETLAWTTLALFALDDPDGDLDRLPRGAPLDLEVPEGSPEAGAEDWSAAFGRLVRLVRSETGCCAFPPDREACGALAARRRAERAHVVITNHAFALSRREFFRHLVFDECEHLHDVAHGAFSHAVTLKALREPLVRLHRSHGAGGAGRGPLNRIAAETVPGSPARACVERCVDDRDAALGALARLAHELDAFKAWRDEAGRARDERDHHSLFREYLESDDSAELRAAHRALCDGLNELAGSLAELSEHLDTLPTRGVQRLRRGLEVLRAELAEREEAAGAWIPRDERGAAQLRPATFHDLEATPRGDDVLAARVLLPHEFLGSRYIPDLEGAVFLSATTWLRGGFEASARYLGLARAAAPLPDEDREPSVVRTLRAGEAFDYGRVLVAVPKDAPSPASKGAFLDYVGRFAACLAERTRGRLLVLFTNAEDCARVGRAVQPFFARRNLPFWYQGMPGVAKEELGERFRGVVDSTLFGLDTFWYGADFPGVTLEYLVLVRLPYGVPDRYHHAQCAALGPAEQRRAIYLPRALAKLRQGFGRLMRKESDKGCVFVLDPRVLEPRHRLFLAELPLRRTLDADAPAGDGLARFVPADTDRALREAFAHMGLLADVERRGLDRPFATFRLDEDPGPMPRSAAAGAPEPEPRYEVADDELPF